MVKTYKGCFAAVFIFIDFLVLLLCYSITQAPVLYYILAVVILLSSIFYIVYKLRPDLRDFLDDHVDIPFLYALVVLLCSIAFLRTGAMDLISLKSPSRAVLSNTEFTMNRHILNLNTYRLSGTNEEEEDLTLNINKDLYNSFSYAVPSEELENNSKIQSYAYSENALFDVTYLPGSKRVLTITAQDLPAEDSEDTQVSDLMPDSSNLESLQAEITSIIDATTMEARVTDLKDYSGDVIKNGSTITIHGSMTLLYPFNVQGFYEIKEGDQVEFLISDVSAEDGITVETSYLNLVTAP